MGVAQKIVFYSETMTSKKKIASTNIYKLPAENNARSGYCLGGLFNDSLINVINTGYGKLWRVTIFLIFPNYGNI